MNIKRIFSLWLSTMMMLSIVACNASTPSEEASSEASAESNGGAKDADEKTEGDAASKDTTSGESEKFIFWDKSEYVKGYNDMMQEKVRQFTEKTGIEVEYVIIPSNDQKQKLMAAIEATNPPDLFVSDDMLCAQFVAMDQIANVSDVLATMDLTDSGKELSKLNNEEVLVPLAMLAPGCYWRKDLWEAKGLDMPKTWQDMKDDAAVITDPANGIYALGMPMGASGGGDAESFVRSLILSYGGVPVNETGEVTVNSPETLEALKFAASIYQDKVAPPDAITWDDGGNNSAYLAGTVGIVLNSGSVWSALKEENPDLLAKTEIIPYPAGPSGKAFVPGGSNTFAIFKNGQNPDAAKEFIKFFFEDLEHYNTMIEGMGGMWQPVINGMDDTDFWKDPINAGWMANSKNVVRNFHPAPADEKANLTFANQLCVKAVQNIVVNDMDPQTALDQLEKDFKEIYEG